MNKDLKQESVVKSEILPADGKPKLSAVSFQFLYRKKPNQEFSQEFLSKKKTIIEAMDDFLSRKKNLYDIDEEIEVTYQDGKQEMIKVDARQDWDRSWYFVFENQMICGNGYACQYIVGQSEQLVCDKCKMPYTKEEIQVGHCFNCGEMD